MNQNIKYIALYIAITLSVLSATAQKMQYGLEFRSYEVEKEKRTGLNLSPDKPLSLPEEYFLSFDLRINPVALYPFGYVFRIIDENGKHIDFLLNEKKNTGIPTMLIAYSSEEIFNATLEDTGIAYNTWYHIEIGINTTRQALIVKVGDKQIEKHLDGLNTFRKLNIVFGKSNYPGFQVTDIPTMSLRNIKIADKNNNLIYHWPLNEYAKNGVYDEIKRHFAECENPDWIISKHVFWQKQHSFTTIPRPMMNYNPDENELAIYDQEYFIRYKLNSKKLTKEKVNGDLQRITQSNNLIYNKHTGKYIYYTFELETEMDVLSYDTLKNEWDKTSNISSPPDFWQHNRFISDKNRNLYLFGGYGHHKYKNDLRIYDFKTNKWIRTQLKGDDIKPRYLSGLGKLDDNHILIFGGYGNQTGNQELSPRYFYDLYKVNLETLQSQKLWELETPVDNFVVGNTIVVDTAANSFYAMAFPPQQFHTKMVLLKFSIDKPEYEVLGDSIEIGFEDNKSYVDLYLDKQNNQLVAISSGLNNIEDTLNTVSVYTLLYPPLAKKDLFQEEEGNSSNLFTALVLILLFVALSILLIWIYIKKRKTKQQIESVNLQYDDIASRPVGKEIRNKSVSLFGGFCVIDKDGNDITKEFTPMLKQLFVLVLLYTFKSGKGISSVKLKEILWFDKSDESAKNNRGVSLSKLRIIFEQIGAISIKSNNSYWTIDLGDDVYCDYSQALYLIDKLSRNKNAANIEDIKKLLGIVSTGELLPNLQVEWVDPFKADFSNSLVDLLLDLSKQPEIKSIQQICIDIADVIFIHDSLNEDALRLKCTLLVKMGRNGMAKKVYASFAKEYGVLFGTDFEYTFDQIINQND